MSVAFVFLRAAVYSALFLWLVLLVLPEQILTAAGIRAPAAIGAIQIGGIVVVGVGLALALACILTFVFVGAGTPAPFDPPRRLVVRGPYRRVRNPMYVGAGTALIGTSAYYESGRLLAFAAGFFVVTHLFVRVYEEPTLRETFGAEYVDYCRRVGRWWPRGG